MSFYHYSQYIIYIQLKPYRIDNILAILLKYFYHTKEIKKNADIMHRNEWIWSKEAPMSTKISSGLTLSSDYFMRNFYKNNRNVIKTSGRSDYSSTELSYEDSRALSRAAKRLLSNDYGSDSDEEDSDISDTTKAAIEAFVTTYNNAIDSGTSSTDHDTKHYLKQLKNLTSEHADELEEIGISVGKNGKLTIDDSMLTLADNSKARSLFSPDQEYSKSVLSIARKMNTSVQNDIFAQVNGKGLHVNITL
jgi:hypothetical protein